jgi:hypothetical protein
MLAACIPPSWTEGRKGDRGSAAQILLAILDDLRCDDPRPATVDVKDVLREAVEFGLDVRPFLGQLLDDPG